MVLCHNPKSSFKMHLQRYTGGISVSKYSHVFVTFADRQGAAPLSIQSALSTSISTEDVTSVTGEVDNIIQVKLTAVGSPVGRVAGMATSDGCRSGDSMIRNWRRGKYQVGDYSRIGIILTDTNRCCSRPPVVLLTNSD